MLRPKATILVLLCMIVVLYLFYVYSSVEIASRGIDYELLSNELIKIKLENKELKVQVLTEESYNVIREKAIKQGFIDKSGYILIR